MEELIFHAEDHRYEQSGETLPSVTRLTDIYGAVTVQEDDILTLMLEAAAERGTVLHSYLEHRFLAGCGRTSSFQTFTASMPTARTCFYPNTN